MSLSHPTTNAQAWDEIEMYGRAVDQGMSDLFAISDDTAERIRTWLENGAWPVASVRNGSQSAQTSRHASTALRALADWFDDQAKAGGK